MLLNARYVIAVHDDILNIEGGLPGFAQAGPGGVDAVLARVENHAHYALVTSSTTATSVPRSSVLSPI